MILFDIAFGIITIHDKKISQGFKSLYSVGNTNITVEAREISSDAVIKIKL